MGKVIFAILLGGALVAGVIAAVGAHNDEVSRLQLESDRQRIRAEFVERSGAINAASNLDRHREELATLVKWYDSSLAQVYNQFPGLHDPDATMKELQAQVAAGKMKAEELANRKEFYDETKNLYDMIEKGHYAAMETTVLEGVRVDILSIKRATYEGKSRLRMDVVLWGAPRRQVATKIEQGRDTRTKPELDFAFHGLDMEFIDADEKLLGGGSAGAPSLLVDYPEHWIPDFPPQVALAVWYFDPFPADTKVVDLKMNAEVKSPTAQAFPVMNEWKLPAQADWLIRPGETFEGEERTMSKEELDRSGNPKHAGK
jgi:hypothetical protein